MKKLTLLLLLLAYTGLCKAQYTLDIIKIPAKNKSIFIASKDASLDIVGYDGDDIVIQPLGPMPVTKTSAAAAGLKLVSSATDGAGSFKPEITRNTEKLIAINLPESIFKDIRILVPKNTYLNVTFSTDLKAQRIPTTGGTQSKISLSKLNGELDVIGAATIISLTDVTGPITIDARNNGSPMAGAQKVIISYLNTAKFKPADNGKPKPLINIISRYADVDIALPRDIKATIKSDITYGDLYSDLELAATNEGATKSQYTGTINGGGNIISIYAGYGNVYIRQQKPLLK